MKRHNEALWPMFQSLCATHVGTVLEVGSRIVSPGSSSKRSLFANNRYVGFDIYKDENTDIVGDAHELSKHVSGTVDAVFSLSVLEHLAAPWLFALEVSKVLSVGGITFHATHFHWPEHELPWDFYRFSDYGLSALFSPLFGFEVLHTAVYAPGYMDLDISQPGMRQARCWGGSAILAKKVAEPHISVSNIDMSLVYPPDTRYPHEV
jgi:SAM-dependent methyltransferase